MNSTILPALVLVVSLPAAAMAADGAEAAPALPRALSLQEWPQGPPTAPQAPPEDTAAASLIDFGRLDIGVRAGLVAFSQDFESSAQAAGSVLLHAPLPWLSRTLLGLAEDDFGIFLEITFSRIDRDTTPPLADSSSPVVFIDGGLDFTLLRSDDFRVLAQAGFQYGHFGGVDGLDNGVAALAGLVGEGRIAERFWVTLSPQVAFGHSGDRVYFVHLGVDFRF